MRNVSLIVAATVRDFGIGANGSLPWRVAEDMKFFKETTITTKDETKQNAVIMGRKTWESIPKKFRPLPSRLNIVLTRDTNSEIAKDIRSMESAMVCSSFESAMECLSWPPYSDCIESIYVIGGAQVYSLCIDKYLKSVDAIYLTQIMRKEAIECDVHLQSLQSLMEQNKCQIVNVCDEKICANDASLTYKMIKLIPQKSSTQNEQKTDSECLNLVNDILSIFDEPDHEEYQYLNLIKHIMQNGVQRGDRTGTGTLSIFGAQMRYSLNDFVFPLLTTKRVFWRGVAEELLWFVSGSTSAKELQEKKIHIWDGNSTREFLDKQGLKDREVGDLGPVYGFQWRHFGAEYKTMHDCYDGMGVDQLTECINQIKHNPNSRRIVMSAWNPSDLKKMALPPCHMFVQFYVANGKLSCQMYQRSADMGLGVPFNIASYALLTRLMAQVCDLEAGEFVHTIGDAHIYLNHVEPLKEQLKRKPFKFPILKINPNKKNIDEFEYKDFKIIGYKCHKTIKMKMAV